MTASDVRGLIVTVVVLVCAALVGFPVPAFGALAVVAVVASVDVWSAATGRPTTDERLRELRDSVRLARRITRCARRGGHAWVPMTTGERCTECPAGRWAEQGAVWPHGEPRPVRDAADARQVSDRGWP